MDATIAADIQQHLAVALSRYGEANPLVLEGDELVLRTAGTENRVAIAELVERWDSLSDIQRSRRCATLARQLTEQRRKRNTPQIERKRSSAIPMLAVVLLVAAGGAFWLSSDGPGGEVADSSSEPILANETSQPTLAVLTGRDERAARVCDATRLRVLRGATVGPTDVEGWVVEIALMRDHTSVPWGDQDQFVRIEEDYEESRLIWKGTPKLNAIQGYATGVKVRINSYPKDNAPLDQLLVTLHGGYVKSYFQERQRTSLVRLARGLAESYGATHGALYGRCNNRLSHHLGSWFMGTDPAESAVSLLYFMGATSAPAYLAPELLTPKSGGALTPGYAIAQLDALTTGVTRSALASWIGSQDGTVAGRAGTNNTPGFAAIQFPFVDSNRALRASRSVYRALRAKNSE